LDHSQSLRRQTNQARSHWTRRKQWECGKCILEAIGSGVPGLGREWSGTRGQGQNLRHGIWSLLFLRSVPESPCSRRPGAPSFAFPVTLDHGQRQELKYAACSNLPERCLLTIVPAAALVRPLSNVIGKYPQPLKLVADGLIAFTCGLFQSLAVADSHLSTRVVHQLSFVEHTGRQGHGAAWGT